jgi:hypothetical protein
MQALASEGRLCVGLAFSFNLEGVVGSCRVLGVQSDPKGFCLHVDVAAVYVNDLHVVSVQLDVHTSKGGPRLHLDAVRPMRPVGLRILPGFAAFYSRARAL